MTEPIRLQKALSAAGVSSRRKAEEMMLQGRVKVNGKVVRELGTRVDPQSDAVMVDGRPIQLDPDRIYLAFHKPKGIVSTMEDEYGRPCLADFFTQYDRVFNVGRLDQDTSGILLMTNDGDLANQLAHPSYEVEKLYFAKVKGYLHQRLDVVLINELDAVGLLQTILELDTISEPLKFSFLDLPFHLREVELLNLIAWVRELVCQVSVVCHQQNAGGVLI